MRRIAIVAVVATILAGPLWLIGRALRPPADDPAEAAFARAQAALAGNQAEAALAALAEARGRGYDPEVLKRFEAVLEIEAGRRGKAEATVRQAVTQGDEPKAELLRALARLELASYRLTAARSALRRWAEAAPDDPAPWLWLADVAVRSGDTADQVVTLFGEAIGRDPTCAAAYLGLAEQRLAAHRAAEAAESLRIYQGMRPDDPRGWALAARIHLAEGRLNPAAADLDRALESVPDDPEMLRTRAEVALRLDDPGSAEGFIRRAVQADPTDHRARRILGQVLDRQGQGEEARKARAQAEELRAAEAKLEQLRAVVLRTPDDPQARHDVAAWLLAAGRDEQALAWAEQALRLAPNHPATHRLLVGYYEKRGEPGKANAHRLLAGPGP